MLVPLASGAPEQSEKKSHPPLTQILDKMNDAKKGLKVLVPHGSGGPRHNGKKAPPPLTEILSRMNDAAKRLKTISADLEYTKVTVLVNDWSTEYGKLFFRKARSPEILIKIEKPDRKMILLKKNKATMYVPRTKELQEYDLSQHRSLVEQFFLLGFGTESDELKKSYEIKFLGEKELDGDTTAMLELIPREKSVAAQLTKIELWVSEESWLTVQQKFYEPGGDYMIARYSEVKVNRWLPPSTFRLDVSSEAKHSNNR